MADGPNDFRRCAACPHWLASPGHAVCYVCRSKGAAPGPPDLPPEVPAAAGSLDPAGYLASLPTAAAVVVLSLVGMALAVGAAALVRLAG